MPIHSFNQTSQPQTCSNKFLPSVIGLRQLNVTFKKIDAARGTPHKNTLLIDRVEYPKYILSLHIVWCWIITNDASLMETHLLGKLANPVKDSFEDIKVNEISSDQSLNQFRQPYIFRERLYSPTSRHSA